MISLEDMGQSAKETEEIVFTHFLSDYDPSFLLLLTYSPQQRCSFLKVLKIYNQIEQEEDWSNNGSNNGDQEEKTYSMIEDQAKQQLIQNIR